MLPRFAYILLPVLVSIAGAEPKIEQLATDYTFTEGPALNPLDGSVYFSDVPNSRIIRWDTEAGVTVFREDTHGANGLMFDPAGNLYMCESKGRALTMLTPDGDYSVLAGQYGDGQLNSPNDLWIAPDGGIYFTDPRYGKKDNLEQDGEHVYHLSVDRKSLTRVADDTVRPNGILGTPDGKTLYIADHGASKTWYYAIGEDGTLHDKALFAEQGSDGMSMDAAGNLYLTSDAVDVYAPNGERLDRIVLPERPANVIVIGEEPVVLFVTAQKSIYRVTLER